MTTAEWRLRSFVTDFIEPVLQALREDSSGAVAAVQHSIPTRLAVPLMRAAAGSEAAVLLEIARVHLRLRALAEALDWIDVALTLGVFRGEIPELVLDDWSMGEAVGRLRQPPEETANQAKRIGDAGSFARYLAAATVDLTPDRQDFLATWVFGSSDLREHAAEGLEIADRLLARRPEEPLPSWLLEDLSWAVRGADSALSRRDLELSPNAMPSAWRSSEVIDRPVERIGRGRPEPGENRLRQAFKRFNERMRIVIRIVEAPTEDPPRSAAAGG